jgi:hypothetical protein
MKEIFMIMMISFPNKLMICMQNWKNKVWITFNSSTTRKNRSRHFKKKIKLIKLKRIIK